MSTENFSSFASERFTTGVLSSTRKKLNEDKKMGTVAVIRTRRKRSTLLLSEAEMKRHDQRTEVIKNTCLM